MNKSTKYILTILSVVAIGAITILVLQWKKPAPIAVQPTPASTLTPTFTPTVSESPIPTIISTPDPRVTANWKTYKNDKYGIEIKYPRDFKIIESSLRGIYGPANSEGIVSIEKILCCNASFEDGMDVGIAYSSDKSGYLSPDDLFKKEILDLKESKEISRFSLQKFSYGNFEGIKAISIDPEITKVEYIDLYWKTENGLYYISWFSADLYNKGFSADNYFIPMLSTLKITK